MIDGFTDHSDVCGLVKGRAAITVVSVETSTMLHQQLDLTRMAGKASLETSSAGATVNQAWPSHLLGRPSDGCLM